MTAKHEILKQIDAALSLWETNRLRSKYDDLSDLHDRPLLTEIKTVVAATIDRLAPPKSPYRAAIDDTLPHRVGALRALRRDYDLGYLTSVQSLVRAELFEITEPGEREATASERRQYDQAYNDQNDLAHIRSPRLKASGSLVDSGVTIRRNAENRCG